MKGNPSIKAGLRAMGFRPLGTVAGLQGLQKCGMFRNTELQSPGVYAIACPDSYKHSFLPLAETCRRCNVISPLSHKALKAKWVDGVEVLYFGRAKRLRDRLTQLIAHSLGLTTEKGPHKGGEIVWQLIGYEAFEVLFLPTDTPIQAEGMEVSLISEFCRRNDGKKPFGNKKRPPGAVDCHNDLNLAVRLSMNKG